MGLLVTNTLCQRYYLCAIGQVRHLILRALQCVRYKYAALVARDNSTLQWYVLQQSLLAHSVMACFALLGA